MKLLALLLSALCLCASLSGCGGLSYELSEREFCEAVAVDYAQGSYTLSALCFNLSYGNDNQDQPKYRLFTGDGENLNAALDDLEDRAQKELSFDKLTAVVLGCSVDWQFQTIIEALSTLFYTNCGASVFMAENAGALLESTADKDLDFTEFVQLCEGVEPGGESLGFPLYEISNAVRESVAFLPFIETDGELLSCTALAVCGGSKSELIEDKTLMDAILLVKNRTHKLRVEWEIDGRAVTAWLTEPRVQVSYDRLDKSFYVTCSARLVTADTVRQQARSDNEYRLALERRGEQALQEYFLLAVGQCAQRYGANLLDRSYYESIYTPDMQTSPFITVKTDIRSIN